MAWDTGETGGPTPTDGVRNTSSRDHQRKATMPVDTPESEWPFLAYASMFEMRSPLITIDGYTRMLELERSTQQFRSLTAQQREVLKHIRTAVVSARAQLERLEALGQVEYQEARGGSPKTVVIALGGILGEVIAELAARRIEQPSLELLPTEGDDRVIGHPILLKGALRGVLRMVIFQMNSEGSLAIKIFDRPDSLQRWVVIADATILTNALSVPPERLEPFDPVSGLHGDVPYARRVLTRGGGGLWGLPARLRGAVVALPRV
jgi:hypothetical protein